MSENLDWLTDNQLMERVKEGDVEQLGLIFQRYKKPLYQYFYHVSRDATYADDGVQVVFERVLKYKHRFRGDGDFRAWLFHIARNCFYDHLSKKRHRIDDIEDWKDRVAERDDTAEKLSKRDDLNMLNEAMQQLSPDKREILVMSKIKGIRYKVIAEVMNCSEGAVKVKVFRAIKELKKVYFQIEQSHGYASNQ
jgi:RNA polymerase sigma factor (sigma-70 family)